MRVFVWQVAAGEHASSPQDVAALLQGATRNHSRDGLIESQEEGPFSENTVWKPGDLSTGGVPLVRAEIYPKAVLCQK